MTEQPTTEPAEELTCSWQRGGDFCLQPVTHDGDLCPHHQKLHAELKAQEKRNAKRKPRPKPEPEPEEVFGVEGIAQLAAGEIVEMKVTSVGAKSNGAKKKPSKYERQKRVIRLAAGSLLESGMKGGLTAQQVETLAEMLDVLGFLQEGGAG